MQSSCSAENRQRGTRPAEFETASLYTRTHALVVASWLTVLHNYHGVHFKDFLKELVPYGSVGLIFLKRLERAL